MEEADKVWLITRIDEWVSISSDTSSAG